MAKNERMKNGLDMLFEDNFHDEESAEGGVVQTMRISLIEPDKNQPRSEFDAERLRELSENIAQHGVLQPILVRPMGEDVYRIVAGERRWRAARMAGLTEIPVVVRELSDLEAAQIALIENLQREDLNPIEEAKAYKRLMEDYGMTQEELSKTVGRSRAAIANAVRLLNLPESVQGYVAEKKLTVGHAKVLCGLSSESVIQEMAERTMTNFWTVRQLEKQIIEEGSKEYNGGAPKKSDSSFADPFKKYALESQMALHDTFAVDSKISKERAGRVTLKITFTNENELKEFMKRISNK